MVRVSLNMTGPDGVSFGNISKKEPTCDGNEISTWTRDQPLISDSFSTKAASSSVTCITLQGNHFVPLALMHKT